MKKIFKFGSIVSLAVLLPVFVFAANTDCNSLSGLGKLICQTTQLLNSIIPLLLALGMVYFVWGVVQYIIADGEEGKKKGKNVIVYGIIGLAVIVSVWGLVNILTSTFHLDGQVPSVSSLTPSQVAGNQSACNGLTSTSKFQDYLNYFSTCIINNSIIPLIFAVAVVMLIWGMVKFFIINSDEEAKRAQGKQYMIWGIIALAVMLSVWGLVGILQSTFNLKTGSSVLPQIQPSTSGS